MSIKFIKPQGALQEDLDAIAKVIKRVGYVLVTPKVDGIRALLEIDDDLKGTLLSRSGKPIPALSGPLAGDFSNVAWQPGRFDFEATVKGMDFRTGTGRLRKKVELPLADLMVWPIQYQLAGAASQPFDLRHSMAEGFADNLRLRRGVGVGEMTAEPIDNLPDLQRYYAWARGEGYEGCIAHDPRGEVREGKVAGWWKLKPEETEDGKITGFFEGEGKLAGMLGGVVVELESGETTRVGTGWTDADRTALWATRDALVGRYCEVRFMERTGAGGVRHPAWHGFRDLPGSPGVKS